MSTQDAQVRAWKQRSHPVWLYRFVQWAVGWFVRLLFLTSRRNIRTVPRRGPVILASNHVSNIDPVLVVASMHRTVHHMAKHTLFRSWFGRFFFETLAGQIPVDRDAGGNEAALEAGVAVLERGLALGIYPEGVRSTDGRLGEGRTGVARLAYATGTTIYPVAVSGTFRAWRRGRTFPWLFRRTRVEVGKPIAVPRSPERSNDPVACKNLTDQVMAGIRVALGPEANAPTHKGWRLPRHPNR